MFAGRDTFCAGAVSFGVGTVGSVRWCRGSWRRVASVRSCCTFLQIFVRFVPTLMGTYVSMLLFRSGCTHDGLVSTSFLELPSPCFPPFRFVRVHGLVDEFRHVSTRPPHLVRCFPSASLCFRFACSSRVCACFGFPREPTNATVRISFPLSFFFGGGFVPSSYGVSPLPPLEKIPLVFPFRISFWRG